MTPEGSLALNMQGVRGLFANSTVWQTWAEVTNAADPVLEAGNRVHAYGPPAFADPPEGATRDELEVLRPFVVLTLRPPIDLPSQPRSLFRSRRSGSGYLNSYTLYAYLCADIPENYTAEGMAAQAFEWFQIQLGKLIDDLWAQTFGPVDLLAELQSVELVGGPQRNTKTFNATQGDFMECVLEIDSGGNSL